MTHMPEPRRRRRSGYTLIEMLLVITVIGALSVIGAGLIGLLMSAESRGTAEIVAQSTFARLGRQLRTDVHAAASAEVAAAADTPDGQLNLQLSDGRSITYIAEQGRIVRESDADADGKSRQDFLLPEGTSRFVVDEPAGLVRLEHRRPYTTATEADVEPLQRTPLRVMQIEAALNLDYGGAESSSKHPETPG